MDLTPDQAADAVERHGCPKCGAPADSTCRTQGGKTAVKYHTVLVSAPAAGPLAEESRAK